MSETIKNDNRVKLPSCVVAGMQELFSNPAAVYTRHLEKKE